MALNLDAVARIHKLVSCIIHGIGYGCRAAPYPWHRKWMTSVASDMDDVRMDLYMDDVDGGGSERHRLRS